MSPRHKALRGEFAKTLRRAMGSRPEMAEFVASGCGTSPYEARRWFVGTAIPSPDELRKFCELSPVNLNAASLEAVASVLRRSHRSRKTLSRKVSKEERRLADDIGGSRVFLSGAGDVKGDVRAEHTYSIEHGELLEHRRWAFRVESKITGKPSYRISVHLWEKILREATSSGEEPVFAIRLPHGPKTPLRIAVIRHAFALEVLPGAVNDQWEDAGKKTYSFHNTKWWHLTTGTPPHVGFRLLEHRLVALAWQDLMHHIQDSE